MDGKSKRKAITRAITFRIAPDWFMCESECIEWVGLMHMCSIKILSTSRRETLNNDLQCVGEARCAQLTT